MTQYHNFLDEYSHDLHGLVELEEIPPIEGQTLKSGEHLVSIKGIGMGIVEADILVYNPNIWRTINENEDFTLCLAIATVQKVEYEDGDSADNFRAITIVRMLSATDFLKMLFDDVNLIQKYYTQDGIRFVSWKVSLDLLDDLEGKAALRLNLESSPPNPYAYGHHNPNFT